jgi:hypothetical protein
VDEISARAAFSAASRAMASVYDRNAIFHEASARYYRSDLRIVRSDVRLPT